MQRIVYITEHNIAQVIDIAVHVVTEINQG